MLSKIDIENDIAAGRISLGDAPRTVKVDSSSVDLTVGLIYPRDSIDHPNASLEIREHGRAWHSIKPGEMVVVETGECVKLPDDVGGIVFPPNRLTKSGIVMTNPGHVDPGYEGNLTFCLINMSVGDVLLSSEDVIATLLLFDLTSPSPGYSGEKGRITLRQVERIGKDFANLNNRTTASVMAALNNRLALLVGILALVLTLVVAIAPLLSGFMSNYFEFGVGSRIDRLEGQMSVIEKELELARIKRGEI